MFPIRRSRPYASDNVDARNLGLAKAMQDHASHGGADISRLERRKVGTWSYTLISETISQPADCGQRAAEAGTTQRITTATLQSTKDSAQ